VDFYLSDGGLSTVEEVGYVRLDAGDAEESRSSWRARRTGRNPAWR
jgi:hypothetical protein